MKIIKNIVGYILLLTITSLVLAIVVMLLWNNVIPDIFGTNTITFWQAFQLNLLSAILIKGTNFGGIVTKSNSESTENITKTFVKKK